MPYYFGHFQLHRWFWLWIESGVVSSDYEWITKIVIPSFRIGVETQKLLEVQLKIHLLTKVITAGPLNCVYNWPYGSDYLILLYFYRFQLLKSPWHRIHLERQGNVVDRFSLLFRALLTPQIILAVDRIGGCHIQLGMHNENCHFKFFGLECWDTEFRRRQSEDSLSHRPSLIW